MMLQDSAPCVRSYQPRGAVRRVGVPVVLPHAGLHDVQREFSTLRHVGTDKITEHSALWQAYLILATVVGAALGNFIFSTHMDIDAVLAGGADGKGMACH